MSLKLTCLFLLCSSFCVSQEINISGKVQDNHDSPISYANVILVDKYDDAKVLGTITNSRGTFLVDDVEPGTYNLEVSFVGYSSYVTELVVDKNIDLKPVILQVVSQEELNVIEITIDDTDKS